MRVVLDSRYPADRYPGIARYVEVLGEGLAQLPDGPQLTLLSEGPPPRSWAEQWRLPLSAEVGDEGGAQPTIRRARTASPFDLWHAPYLVFPYAVPLPVVVTIFDVIGIRPGAGTNRRAVALAVRLALRRARLVLTASRASAREIGRAFPTFAHKLRVVPAAVAARFRAPGAEARRSVTERLGLPHRYLLYVGTDRPHKNLARLTAAVARYRATASDDIVLLVAGPREGRVAAGADTAAVRFLGRVPDDDLPALYAGAQLFVTASSAEGFGFPVLEAMACGTAVACSDTPALVEVTGDAAVRFATAEPPAIAGAIVEAMECRAELARRSLARAAAYSPARTAALTAEVYREALDRPSRWRYHP
ncbi:MAG TPA: glycosyltransferase family 1 protein [Acidimicrobiales bacterium]|nr:glycosyltransferase family 1 protein [Acidimicrobiales bacterium]